MIDLNEMLHPVRLRIVQTLLGEDGLTTSQIHVRMEEVPIATLYRHMARLLKSGILVVVGKEKIRGVSEKTYCLAENLGNMSVETMQQLPSEQLLAVFVSFCSGLIAQFERYVASGNIDLDRDGVHFHQVPLNANEDEVQEFRRTLGELLDRLSANPASKDRRLRIFTSALIPRPFPDDV